ncbi:MAG: NAD-binding protein [Actinomycetia bacterium]|nr:NAD-binding protein [Actinomycetes bacterium]
MRVVLIGGGKVGAFLARELVSAGHFVAVIEESEDRAQALSDEVDAVVIHGDGTNVEKLKSASVHDADWLVAVTGLDEVNLVACELGLTLGADRVLARLNNPWNRPTFDALKIPVVGITDLMVQVISQEVAVSQLHRVAVIGRGELSLCELDIPRGFAPIELQHLTLPEPSVVVAIAREDDVIVPQATTELRPGDRITAVTTIAQESALHQVFAPNGNQS